MVDFNSSWNQILKEEFEKEYYIKLRDFLKEEVKEYTIYPESDDIFNALKSVAFEDVKVCIIGQDPYHGEGQAHGMAFSVKPGIKIPPSLKNIYKELNSDLGLYIPNNGYLVKWADQGVMLLNTSLTVRKGLPASHKGRGWELFTDSIIKILSTRDKPIIFILWGNHAIAKEKLITNPNHIVLKCAHPSPFSAYNGFFGCNHFSKSNEILKSMGENEIDWQIENI